MNIPTIPARTPDHARFADDALIALHHCREERDDLYRFAQDALRDLDPIYEAAQVLGLWSLCHRLADLRAGAEAAVRRVDGREGGAA